MILLETESRRKFYTAVDVKREYVYWVCPLLYA